ncbi:MAG: VWA domain-containing protein [Candidatus Acidiferrales bacterium]
MTALLERRSVSAGFFALALLCATTAAAQEPPPDTFRFRVNVQLVLLPTSVSTSDGRSVSDLAQEAFEVYEEGELRPLRLFERQTAIPLQLVVLIDASLSAAVELPAQKDAVARFLRRVARAQDHVAIYQLSGKNRSVADFSNDTPKLLASVKEIREGSGTALYDVLVEASEKLKAREGRRVVVVVSDGNDTTSKSNFQAALRALQEAEVTLFALVVRPIAGESGRSVRGEHTLITLANLTGGRVFFPAGTGELDRFYRELDELLRTQYLLGYQPAPPGFRQEFRLIEVRVKGGDYTVRHRQGYYSEPLSASTQ